jgi:hypothetical protein
MNRTIELNCYCQICGSELDSEFTMSAKRYNEARIDITPCKVCDRSRSIVSAPIGKAIVSASLVTPPPQARTSEKERRRFAGSAARRRAEEETRSPTKIPGTRYRSGIAGR